MTNLILCPLKRFESSEWARFKQGIRLTLYIHGKTVIIHKKTLINHGKTLIIHEKTLIIHGNEMNWKRLAVVTVELNRDIQSRAYRGKKTLKPNLHLLFEKV